LPTVGILWGLISLADANSTTWSGPWAPAPYDSRATAWRVVPCRPSAGRSGGWRRQTCESLLDRVDQPLVAGFVGESEPVFDGRQGICRPADRGSATRSTGPTSRSGIPTKRRFPYGHGLVPLDG